MFFAFSPFIFSPCEILSSLLASPLLVFNYRSNTWLHVYLKKHNIEASWVKSESSLSTSSSVVTTIIMLVSYLPGVESQTHKLSSKLYFFIYNCNLNTLNLNVLLSAYQMSSLNDFGHVVDVILSVVVSILWFFHCLICICFCVPIALKIFLICLVDPIILWLISSH